MIQRFGRFEVIDLLGKGGMGGFQGGQPAMTQAGGRTKDSGTGPNYRSVPAQGARRRFQSTLQSDRLMFTSVRAAGGDVAA